jgi:hypothetical protein
MRAHILCVDDNGSRSADRRRSLEDVGFVVMYACDETQAAELLKSHPVDVVCVDSHSLNRVGSALGASIKNVKPRVPLILICDKDTTPGTLGEHVDIVMDEPDFDTKGQWLLEELCDAYAPFFLRWLDEWLDRELASKKDESSGIC